MHFRFALRTIAAGAALLAGWQPAAPARAADLQSGGGGGTRLTLRCTIDDVRVTRTDGTDHVALAGAATPLVAESGQSAGQPALPLRAVRVLLPPETRIAAVRVVPDEPAALRGSYLPAPLAGRGADGALETAAPDPAIYNGNAPWPSEPPVRFRSGWMRGFAIGRVWIAPLQYIGAGGELRLWRRLEVELQIEALPAERAAAIRHRAPSRARLTPGRRELEWLRGHVANPGDLERFYPGAAGGAGLLEPAAARPFAGFRPTELPSTDGPPVRYVVVTDSVTSGGRPVGDLVGAFQRLADWKTAKGTPAVVRTTSWIRDHYPGHDTAARVRAFLIDAYQQWGTDYVLLGGDLRIVPARRFNGINLGAGDPPADVYYGGLDGSWDTDRDGIYGEDLGDASEADPYWDLWVGRAPVEDAGEAAVFVDKCLTYARAPGTDPSGVDPAYYERLLLLAGLGNCATWGATCNGLYVGETILRRLAPPGFDVTRMYQQLLDPSPGCAYHQTYVETADSAQVAWTVDAALATLEAGVGFVHHFEHSNPYTEGGASGGFGCAASTGGALGVEYIDQLTNAPNWPVVVSTGAGVNAFDYESVSEHWVLSPTGGAVAYIGKTRSGSIASITGEVDTLAFEQLFVAGADLGQTLAFATQGVATGAVRAAATFDLLGDPELAPWTAAPGALVLELTPAAPAPGEQLLAVTVLEAATQAPLAGARVALAQGDRLYAFATSDAGGVARFAVALAPQPALAITATARNHQPAALTVTPALPAAARVTYVQHAVLDDSLAVANANGVADAGEGLKLEVTVENSGLAAAVDATVTLSAIGAVTLEVTIDGACQPALVDIGALDGHPPGGGCTAAFPALEFEGVLPAGRPAAYLGTADPGLFVWRDGDTWHLVARGPAAPAPPPMQLSGTVRVPGGHSGAAAGALEPGDGWAAPDGETLTFDFTTTTSGDQDSLVFAAREVAWLAVPAATAGLGTLAPGAGAGARFLLATTPAVPDRHEARLELAVVDGGGTAAGRSSFTLPIAAPLLDPLRQEVALDAGGPIVVESIDPTLRNRGSGVADQVTAVLRLEAGTAAITDSTIVFGALPGGASGSAGADRFVFSTSDTSAVRFRLELRNRFPDGSTRSWWQAAVDVVRPCPPGAVRAAATAQRSARLFWEPPAASGCAADLSGYTILRRLASEGEFTIVADIDSTASYFDTGITADTTFVYAVAARDSSGNLSGASVAAGAGTWVPEHAGWPLRLDAGTTSSPLAVDVDGDGRLEIFALGNALFGWDAGGAPLIPGAPDGVIFAPPRPPDRMRQSSTGAFLSSPAAADLDGDGSTELIIAAWDDSLWVVRPTGELLWGRYCVPKYSSPALGDLDGDGDLEIVIGSDQPVVYAWHHDGSPVIAANPDGKFADLADGAYINYSSPALADLDGDPLTEEVLFASFRGTVYAWDATATLLWSVDVGPNRPLSTPALGDLDRDGVVEAVVAQGNVSTGEAANALYVIDTATGVIEQSWAGAAQIPGKLYSTGNIIHPPSLADLDGDGDLEILLGTSGISTDPLGVPQDGAATVLVFERDGGGGYARLCLDSIPEPGLNMTNNSGETVNAQPLALDLDGDGEIEITAGSTTFGLFMFTASTGLPACAARPGWPLLFAGEVDATPLVADLDGDGRLEMLARARDGELHRFDLGVAASGGGSGGGGAQLQWSQFAHDARHTSNFGFSEATALDPQATPRLGHRLALAQNTPNPCRAPTRIAYRLPRRGRVRLAIYAVDGRLLRVLAERVEAAGRHAVRWDGRDARGAAVATGVYFYRLEAAGRALARKLVVVR